MHHCTIAVGENCAFPQMDRENSALAVEQLVGHLLAEHRDAAWTDPELERERSRVGRLAREHSRRAELAREEAAVQVPRLPASCPVCGVQCRDAETWRHHAMAHRVGEVFCATCRTPVLAHRLPQHRAGCVALPAGVARVEVTRVRADTWLEVAGRRVRVYYDYRQSGETGTVARCSAMGRSMTGAGASHQQAVRALVEEVQRYLVTLHEKQNGRMKEELAKADKQALVDLFVELARRDEESRRKVFTVVVDGEEREVMTKLTFTKFGLLRLEASVERGGEVVSGEGATREEAVAALERRLEGEAAREAKFCCLSCGSRFLRERPFLLHQGSGTCA